MSFPESRAGALCPGGNCVQMQKAKRTHPQGPKDPSGPEDQDLRSLSRMLGFKGYIRNTKCYSFLNRKKYRIKFAYT